AALADAGLRKGGVADAIGMQRQPIASVAVVFDPAAYDQRQQPLVDRTAITADRRDDIGEPHGALRRSERIEHRQRLEWRCERAHADHRRFLEAFVDTGASVTCAIGLYSR